MKHLRKFNESHNNLEIDITEIMEILKDMSDEKDISSGYLGIQQYTIAKSIDTFPIYKFKLSYLWKHIDRKIGMYTGTLICRNTGGGEFRLKSDTKKYVIDIINRCLKTQSNIMCIIPKDLDAHAPYNLDNKYGIPDILYATIGFCTDKYIDRLKDLEFLRNITHWEGVKTDYILND